MDKTTLRRQVLAATKAVSKESRNQQSTLLSQRILNHIDVRYLNQHAHKASAGRPVIVCSFLPMYFEPDLQGVMKGLWERRGQLVGGCTPNCIRTVVPHMISSSEMLFVEVKNEEDLKTAFIPQGKWNIVEMIPDLLKSSLDGKDDSRIVIAAPVAGAASFPSLDTSKFFSQENVKVSSGTTVPLAYDMVILCPVAALDVEGRRLGKGAGFYDRFISGVNDSLARRSDDEFKEGATTPIPVLPARCELVGVALEEQRVEVGVIPMDAHDQWLHTVITPTSSIVLKEGARM